MSLTDRDRKILMVLGPILVLLAYWFLLLGPKREAAATAGETLAQAEERRDSAEMGAQQAQRAKATFAADYASLVRLGKAVPSSVDVPSLIVQLDRSAQGTGIRFARITAGEREEGAAGGGAAPSSGSTPPASGGAGQPPTAAGGQQTQSAPGQATEAANDTKANADATSAQREQAGPGGASGSQAPASGSQAPAQGGQAPAAAGSGCAPGLECVPLEFEFSGGFFELADFFHRLKRFVRVANDQIVVRGRLLTIDSFKFSSEQDSFPALKAEVSATVYLVPKAEGTTAGATPSGPAPQAPQAASQTSPPASPAPTATATP